MNGSVFGPMTDWGALSPLTLPNLRQTSNNFTSQ
jgi:hypothetical protein